MRTPIATLLGTLALSIAGCSAPSQDASAPLAAQDAQPEPAATAPSAPSVEPAAGGLAAVLDTANIGRRLDIFERRIGTPTDAGKDWSTYTVGGCTVRVNTEDNVISWISLYVVGDNCSVDIAPLVGSSRVVSKATPLTFGEFDTLSAKRTFYVYPCPGLNCGNAFEPTVMVVNPGSHAEGFIDVEVESSMSDDDYDSFFTWKDKVLAAAGDGSYDLDLECDRRFDEMSRDSLASTVVEGIGFGHRKTGSTCP